VHVFGLTGGIASGKSTVARRYRERGVPVVDADQVARDVVAKGTDGLTELVLAFGEGILTPAGDLDRKALGALVFADEGRRRVLNGITHPRIAAASQAALRVFETAGAPLACYEAALLVENKLADAFRPLVVVAASVAVQRARVKARDGVSDEEAALRIAAQMPVADKVAVADFVIQNDASLEALVARADEVLGEICARVGLDPNRYPTR